MYLRISRLALIVCFLASAIPALAVTYVVPPDRLLIQHADAIVLATAGAGETRLDDGDIVTVTPMRIDEVLKGSIDGAFVDVTEPGGRYGDLIRVLPGAPAFTNGERVLLLLKQRPGGGWAVAEFGLGKFAFATDSAGQHLLVRDEGEIVGWDQQLRPYEEPRRDATRFVDFIRGVVAGKEPAEDYFAPRAPLRAETNVDAKPATQAFTSRSYTLFNCRWPDFTSAETYFSVGTEPGAANGGSTAISAGLNAWKGISGTQIKLTYGGSTGSDNGIQTGASTDGKNSVMFERDLSKEGISPFTCTSNSFSGVLGIGGPYGSGSHTGPNGETFTTIIEGDVEMNKGLANCTLLFNSGDFNTGVAHEIGHSLGFRHADQDPNGNACNSALMDCATRGIMKSFITTGINATPQAWDIRAAQAVYPGANACTPPAISTQPSGSTISSGGSAQLSVAATGTATLAYQWFTGASGNTSSPVPGGTSASISVSPAQTTQYWVQVTNTCGSINSNAVTVTVSTGCPSITVGNPSATNNGSTYSLNVSASGGTGLTFTWFQGNSVGSGTQIGTGNPLTIQAPAQTTSYWVQVANSCGSTANSPRVVTITVSSCTPPTIVTQPQDTSVTPGSSTQLTFGLIATSPATITWYKGTPPASNATAIGTGIAISSGPINATTTFFATITNACGQATTRVMTVTVTQTCTAPAIQSATATPPTATPGQTVTLNVNATGTGLTYQWFKGQPGDTSNPLPNGNAATVTDTPQATTTYWVRVSSSCGAAAANSAPVTVTVSSQCIAPAIVQPADLTVLFGSAATLTVTATAGTDLHYAWFQGAKFDTSHPVGTDSPTLTTAPLTAQTQFFVNVSNGCGNVNSETITVKVQAPRRRPTRR